MRSSLKFLAATVVLFALQGTAFAQSSDWYIGGSIGRSSLKPDNTPPLPVGFTEDTSGVGGSALVGYQFDKIWSVEAALQSLGKYSNSSTFAGSEKARVRGASISVVGLFPVGAGFSLLGRVGVIKHYISADAYGPAAGHLSAQTTDMVAGLGVEYVLTPQVSLRAEYERSSDIKLGGAPIKTSMASIGVRYRF